MYLHLWHFFVLHDTFLARENEHLRNCHDIPNIKHPEDIIWSNCEIMLTKRSDTIVWEFSTKMKQIGPFVATSSLENKKMNEHRKQKDGEQ